MRFVHEKKCEIKPSIEGLQMIKGKKSDARDLRQSDSRGLKLGNRLSTKRSDTRKTMNPSLNRCKSLP